MPVTTGYVPTVQLLAELLSTAFNIPAPFADALPDSKAPTAIFDHAVAGVIAAIRHRQAVIRRRYFIFSPHLPVCRKQDDHKDTDHV